MTDRALKIALIVSLLGNAFLAVAMVVGGYFILHDLNDQRALLRQRTPFAAVTRDLDQGERDQLRQHMRQIALTAGPDLRDARAARKQAAELAGAATFDKAAISADLEKARAAESRAHTEFENGLVDYMQSKPQSTRAVLSRMLLGRGGMRKGGPGRGPLPDGPRPDSPPPPGR
jgi:uncharacterized membrane protein